MICVERDVDASPDQVWRVLSDGWLYPLWVVGASRMREVERGWPGVGTRLHHSFGSWPAVVDDVTEVLQSRADEALELQAHGWPMGEARVKVTLWPSGSGTVVELAEDVDRGPGRLVPRPLRAPMVAYRNRESLRRLAWLCERRAARADDDQRLPA